MPQPDGGVCDERSREESRVGARLPDRICGHQHGRNRQPGHPPARKKLAEHGIDCTGKTARQLRKQDYRDFDFLIGMDSRNLYYMKRICGGDPDHKMHLLLDFAGYTDAGISDPWYTRDFEATWRDVEEGCCGLLNYLTTGNA